MKKLILVIIIVWSAITTFGQTFGNAINLDGIDDYLIVPHHPSLNPEDGSWSVAFWLKAANKDQVSPVVMKRLPEDPYTQYSYGFGKDDPHNPEPGKRLRVNHIDIPGVSERSGHTTEEFIDGNWHHIVFVANKEADGMEIYVDGVLVEFYPMYYYGAWPTVSVTNDLWVASGSSGSKIEGPLDELSIWNKALNQTQVVDMMYDTLSPEYYSTSDSGLVAYYRFDEYEDLGINAGGIDDIRDLSIWGNHADSEGNPELIPSDIQVGINHIEKPADFTISPNPTSGEFDLRSSLLIQGNCIVHLYDLSGRMLLESRINGKQSCFQMNVRDLEEGTYIITLLSREGKSMSKLIIR